MTDRPILAAPGPAPTAVSSPSSAAEVVLRLWRRRFPPRTWPPSALLGLLLALVLSLAGLLGAAVAPVAAEFQGVDYTLTNQNGQDFSGQNLAQTSFAGAQGRDARFAGADLHGAILTQGAFPMADFRGADLSDALMDKVDFAGADFTDAVLVGVIATGSNFTGARVSGADFSDALIDRADQRSLCREASGTNPRTGVDTRLSLGCS
jgi:uncharacterized protein YjbI with pentapeptide repeats